MFMCYALQIWNLENMLPIQTLQRHEGSVNTLILHGDYLLSGSEDREIKVLNLLLLNYQQIFLITQTSIACDI